MFSKNRLLLLVCFLGAVLVLSFGGVFLFYVFLPTYLESKVIPGIGKDLGFKKVSCDVRSVGFTGSDIGSLRIGDDAKPALIIDSIQIDYTLTGLWRGRVERVLLSGIVLYCDVDNGRLAVRGLNSESLFADYPSKKTPTQATSNAFPLVPFNVLEIRNAFVVGSWEGRDLRLPVDLRISVREKQQDGFRCDLLMHVLGQQISSAAHVNFKANSVEIAFEANGFRLAPFAQLATMVPGLSFWGEGDLGGKAFFRLDPWRVASTSVSCELRNGGMAYQGLSFQAGLKGPSGPLPGQIRMESNGDKGTLYVSGISVQTPVPLAVSEFSSAIEKSSTGLRATGQYWLHLDPFERKKGFPMAVLQPIRWKGQYSWVVQENGSWDFSVKKGGAGGSAPQEFAVDLSGVEVTSQLFYLNVQAKGAGGQGSAEFEMDIPVLTVQTGEEARIRMPLVGLKGRMAFQPGERSGDFNLKMPQTEVRVHSVKVFVPHMDVSGRFATDHNERLNMDGSLRFDNALIADPELDIEARGVKGDLHFSWPKEEAGGKGQVLVRSFRWKDLALGTVKGSVRQKGLGVVFDGKHKNTLLPGLTMIFSGVSQMASVQGHETRVAFEILPYKTVSPIDLGRFQPSLEGFSLAGSMAVKGNWRFTPLGAEGAMHGKLTEAKLEMGDDRHSINGLGIELSHFDPLVMRSAPLQQLHFENANFGGLTASNGGIGFQIESANALSIENGSFKWCGGTVHIGATYLSSDNESYDIVLYGDRLNLAMILEQFGVATAQGEGTVNGRIPVRLGKGTIRFGDGFLFSTPGDGGTISLSGTEKLTEGIPPNTPQFAQLELAREALKDFSYKWAKVALATEGDNLVLRMQLDGKPAKPLPFVYKKNIGSFVKMKEGEQRSVFQGIRLDVNFRLPLEKLLHYGNIFQNILEADE